MRNKTPHLIILSVLFSLAHYTQVGAEIVSRSLPKDSAPAVGAISNGAVVVSVWLLIVAVIPRCCRLILSIYDLAERATNAISAWARAKAIELIKLLLARLGQ